MGKGWVKEKAGNRRFDSCTRLNIPRLLSVQTLLEALSTCRITAGIHADTHQLPASHPATTGNVGTLEEAPRVKTRDRMVVLKIIIKTKSKPGEGSQRFPGGICSTCLEGESVRTSLELCEELCLADITRED